MPVQRPETSLDPWIVGKRRRIDVDRLLIAQEEVVKQRRRTAAAAVELGKVDPGGGLANHHARERPAHD